MTLERKKRFTSRVELFIAEMIGNDNQRRAAIAAGFPERSAHVAASRLMKNPEVVAEIDRLRLEALSEVQVNSANVLKEIARNAFANVKDLYSADGSLIPIQDLPHHLAACIQSIEHETIDVTTGRGEDRKTEKIGMTTKIKIADKTKNLEILAKHLKLLNDKDAAKRPLDGKSDEELRAELEGLMRGLGFVPAPPPTPGGGVQ